jgi:hypothetical protein
MQVFFNKKTPEHDLLIQSCYNSLTPIRNHDQNATKTDKLVKWYDNTALTNVTAFIAVYAE